MISNVILYCKDDLLSNYCKFDANKAVMISGPKVFMLFRVI